jgi:ubiquinone/menaquinone biosynthesis C-methylase UbiE
MAADHDLVFADRDAVTARVGAMMSAHLPRARGTLLDAACGTGMACDAAVRLGWEVIGADASPAMLERARARLPEVELVVADVLHLFDGVQQSVDAVISIGDGLASVDPADLGMAVDEMRRCTRLGGATMVAVRDFAVLKSAVWRDDPVCRITALFVNRADGQIEYTLQVEDADGTRAHTRRLHPVSETELRDEMEASGFHVRRTGKMLGRVVLSGVAV